MEILNTTDINKLLKPYKHLDNISEIAEYAIRFQGKSENFIVNKLDKQFGQHKRKEGLKETVKNSIIVGEEIIEPSAISQFYDALKIAPAKGGVLLPDAHYGYSVPIGSVVVLHNAVAPAFVGVDIGCQVNLSIFKLSKRESESRIEEIFYTLITNSGLGLGADNSKFKDSSLKDHLLQRKFFEFLTDKEFKTANKQLGTLGSGNHFVDWVYIEDFEGEECVGLLTHGGSRKTGNDVARRYMSLAYKQTCERYMNVPKGYGWLDIDSELGKEYLKAMAGMVYYADINHYLVHKRIADALELKTERYIKTLHNYAKVFTDDRNVVHRKGAVECRPNKLVLIPGSSGTDSYLCEGGFNTTTYLHSCSHGLGRTMSRTQAKKEFDAEIFEDHMKFRNTLYHGVGRDESSEAYKTLQVLDIQEEHGILKRKSVMRPRIVVMGA